MKKIFKIFIILCMFIVLMCVVLYLNNNNNENSDSNEEIEFIKRDNNDLDHAIKKREKFNDKTYMRESENYKVGVVNTTWSEGSGTLIDKNHVLTASHVVSKPDGKVPDNFSIQYYPYGKNSKIISRQNKPIGIKNIKRIKNTEITILTLNKPITQINPANLAKNELREGEQVKAVGYYNKDGNPSQQYTSYGNFAFERDDVDNTQQTLIMAHIKNHKGMSGGPLFNTNDEVVGITSFMYTKYNYSGFAGIKKLKDEIKN